MTLGIKQNSSIMPEFGLEMTKCVKDLSRGMQMKLMIAAALSHDAKLLILDEPTSGLDVLARDELMDILQGYVEDGRHSVLFSTHITSDLERAADFITYITQGQLYYTGPKDEFEDSFRIVKGGLDQIAGIGSNAIGLRRFGTGFEALVQQEVVDSIVGQTSTFISEPVSIDDIIRLTNTAKAPTSTNMNGE